MTNPKGFARPLQALRPEQQTFATPVDLLRPDPTINAAISGMPRANQEGQINDWVTRVPRHERVFNVTDPRFGAQGDGVTDNFVAFENVIYAIRTESPRDASVVYLPPGTFNVKKKTSYGIMIDSLSNIIFRGAGPGATTLKKVGNGQDHAFIQLQNSDKITFENMTIDGGQTTATTPFSSDPGTGIQNLIISPPGTGGISFFQAHNCIFQSNWGGGIYLYGAADVNITGCSFYGLDTGDVNNAVTLVSSDDVAEPYLGAWNVSNNVFIDNGQVGVAFAAVANPVAHANLIGNIFKNTAGSNGVGWEVVAPDVVNGVNIIGNQVWRVAGGTVQGNHVNVIGNVIRNASRSTPDGFGLQCNSAADTARVVIAHNVIDTCVDEGIGVRGTDVLVHGNIVTNANVGIKVYSDATRARIIDNTLQSNTTNLTDAGTGTEIRGNGSGTAGHYTATPTAGAIPYADSSGTLNAWVNKEVNYTAFTSVVNVTATTEASPTNVVSSGAITYDGTPIVIEFFSPEVAITLSDFLAINLWDGNTNLGYMVSDFNPDPTNTATFATIGRRRLVPSAGSHTYRMRAYCGSGGATINAGAGGSAGTYVPGYIRITKV